MVWSTWQHISYCISTIFSNNDTEAHKAYQWWYLTTVRRWRKGSGTWSVHVSSSMVHCIVAWRWNRITGGVLLLRCIASHYTCGSYPIHIFITCTSMYYYKYKQWTNVCWSLKERGRGDYHVQRQLYGLDYNNEPGLGKRDTAREHAFNLAINLHTGIRCQNHITSASIV